MPNMTFYAVRFGIARTSSTTLRICSRCWYITLVPLLGFRLCLSNIDSRSNTSNTFLLLPILPCQVSKQYGGARFALKLNGRFISEQLVVRHRRCSVSVVGVGGWGSDPFMYYEYKTIRGSMIMYALSTFSSQSSQSAGCKQVISARCCTPIVVLGTYCEYY